MGRVTPPGSAGQGAFLSLFTERDKVFCVLWAALQACGCPAFIVVCQSQQDTSRKVYLTQGHLLQGRPRVPPDMDSFCFTSVFTSAWVFWVTALAQASPLSPCSHSGSRERGLLSFSSPCSGPLSDAWPDPKNLGPAPGQLLPVWLAFVTLK